MYTPATSYSSHRMSVVQTLSCTLAGKEEVSSADQDTPANEGRGKKKFASSWDAKEAGAKEGSQEDFLSNLGTAQNYNINVTHGTSASQLAFLSLFLRVMCGQADIHISHNSGTYE